MAENISEFIAAVKNADNFGVYPLPNGNSWLALTFYGVLTEI